MRLARTSILFLLPLMVFVAVASRPLVASGASAPAYPIPGVAYPIPGVIPRLPTATPIPPARSNNQRSTIIASYQAAFGRDPSSGEVQFWLGATPSNVSLESLIGWHMDWLSGAYDERAAMVRRAFRAALGRSPSSQEFDRWQARIQAERIPYRSLVSRVASSGASQPTSTNTPRPTMAPDRRVPATPTPIPPSRESMPPSAPEDPGPDLTGNLARIGSSWANGEYGDGGEDAAWRGSDGNLETQWSSREQHNSVYRLSLPSRIMVSQVAIWGRGGGSDIDGKLVFSDGSEVGFGSLNGDGSRRAVCFTPRSTTFVEFRTTGMGGRSTSGFREIEAYATPFYSDGQDCGGFSQPSDPAPSQPAPRAGQPQLGQLLGLRKGTQIRTGPGFGFPSTIPAQWGSAVPEENWLVVIKGGPTCADGWEWWDVDRRAAGDPHGGTGWAAISQGCTATPSRPTRPSSPSGQPAAPRPSEPGSGGSTGQGLVPGGAIEAKWLETGGLQGLGAVTIPEQPAAPSPYGTTGMYAAFTRGHINWSGRHGTFVLYGAIDGQYTEIGGSGSRIGFPTSDEYDWSNGRRQDFEGGYIYWDRPSNQTRVWPGASSPNTAQPQSRRLLGSCKLDPVRLRMYELVADPTNWPRLLIPHASGLVLQILHGFLEAVGLAVDAATFPDEVQLNVWELPDGNSHELEVLKKRGGAVIDSTIVPVSLNEVRACYGGPYRIDA